MIFEYRKVVQEFINLNISAINYRKVKEKEIYNEKLLLNFSHLEVSSELARQPVELHYRIPPPPNFPAPTQPPRQIHSHFLRHTGYTIKS